MKTLTGTPLENGTVNNFWIVIENGIIIALFRHKDHATAFQNSTSRTVRIIPPKES